MTFILNHPTIADRRAMRVLEDGAVLTSGWGSKPGRILAAPRNGFKTSEARLRYFHRMGLIAPRRFRSEDRWMAGRMTAWTLTPTGRTIARMMDFTD